MKKRRSHQAQALRAAASEVATVGAAVEVATAAVEAAAAAAAAVVAVAEGRLGGDELQ